MGSKTCFVLIIKSNREAYNWCLDVEGLLQDGSKSKPNLTCSPFLSHQKGSIWAQLSKRMATSNDPPIEESEERIYSEGEGVKDPPKGEGGPYPKGNIPKCRIKGSKWEYSTISSSNNYQLVVLAASSKRSFCSIFWETAWRIPMQIFLSKVMLPMLVAS